MTDTRLFYKIDGTEERFSSPAELEARAHELLRSDGRDFVDASRWEWCMSSGWEWAPYHRFHQSDLEGPPVMLCGDPRWFKALMGIE